MSNFSNSEIGEELFHQDLTQGQVVVMRADHRPDIAITIWVDRNEEKVCWFYAGVTGVTLGLFAQADGSFRDDQNRPIHVYRYLGKP